MIRTCVAVLAGICGTVSIASGQVFTSYDSPAYTTYYGPSYAYSAYGYRDGWGPLGLVNWRRPFAPYGYGGVYTAAYAPSSYYGATTSYYAPLADSTVAYYSAPVTLASNSCCTPCCSSCCTPCCSPACSGGNCPGGNCALNYAPSDMSPRPDPMSSGSRTIESESGGTNDARGGASGADDWRSRPADGYGGTERGAGYPPTRIQQKAPTDVNDAAAAGAEEEAVPEAPEADASEAAPAEAAEPEADENFEAPGSNPAALLLDRDTQVTATPGFARERLSLRARFQSPRLARGTVDVNAVSTNEGVRLVQK